MGAFIVFLIGGQFEIDNDTTVRSVFKRMKKQIIADRDLDRKIEKLQDLIIRSQKLMVPGLE